MSNPLTIKEHIIPAQHLRGYPHATTHRTATLKLAVKQYAPKYAPDDADTDRERVTIIAAHANGIAKEAYEPLWEELSARLRGKLRGIWIADCAHQGVSGVVNEGLVGGDPNWFDHSRDLLAMVNYFRESIRPPVVGIAHSMGCAQIVQLSHIHPRLLDSIILIEPVIQDGFPPGPNAALMSSNRQDLWNSKEEARSYFLRNKFFKTWDPRALEKYLEYGLRNVPTALYPNAPPGSVTLTTTKHQEAWSYVRPTFAELPVDGEVDDKERLLTGDMTGDQAQYVFHRAEASLAFQSLPYLQPSVLWVFADHSYINHPTDREEKVLRTGSASRASGGANSVVIREAGHLLPLEKVNEMADALAAYVEKQLKLFQKREKFWETYDSEKSERGRLVLSGKWMEGVRKRADVKRPVSGAKL